MGGKVHLYTNGADPFTLQIDDITYVIHHSPIVPSQSGGVFIPSVLNGGISLFAAPHDRDTARQLFDSLDDDVTDIGLAIDDDSGSPAREQMQAVVDGVRELPDRDVTVHVMSAEAVRPSDGDG